MNFSLLLVAMEIQLIAESKCEYGAVRLVGWATDSVDTTDSVGTLQFCVNGEWGGVCNYNDWGFEHAQVVCRQLGFSTEYSWLQRIHHRH